MQNQQPDQTGPVAPRIAEYPRHNGVRLSALAFMLLKASADSYPAWKEHGVFVIPLTGPVDGMLARTGEPSPVPLFFGAGHNGDRVLYVQAVYRSIRDSNSGQVTQEFTHFEGFYFERRAGLAGLFHSRSLERVPWPSVVAFDGGIWQRTVTIQDPRDIGDELMREDHWPLGARVDGWTKWTDGEGKALPWEGATLVQIPLHGRETRDGWAQLRSLIPRILR